MYTAHTIHKFFTISNLIEGIDDNEEVFSQIDLFDDLSVWDDERSMYAFHAQMKHLNSYCKAGELRTYDVYVGGRKCMSPEHIGMALTSLFDINPDTPKLIKDWHIRFEKIHPFGDGNGRAGRFLMLRQLDRNNLPIPQMFLSMKNFEENRRKYYRFFTS